MNPRLSSLLDVDLDLPNFHGVSLFQMVVGSMVVM